MTRPLQEDGDEPAIRDARREQWKHLAPWLSSATPAATGALDEGLDGVGRREFLRLAGASAGLAGLGACTRAPDKEILPYSREPPEMTPGVPRFYATTSVLDGYGTGIVVESHEGHPTKVEGNPRHPDSLGATGFLEQALVLSLYDPCRPRSILRHGVPSSWDTFARSHGRRVDSERGKGIRFLLEPTSSLLRQDLIRRVRERLPLARFHYYAPLEGRSGRSGDLLAFGRPVETHADLGRADVILSLEADFGVAGPGWLRRLRGFADARRVSSPASVMNRLYVVESAMSVVGAVADHRLAVRSSDVLPIAAAVALPLLTPHPAVGDATGALNPLAQRAERHARWARIVAQDLLAHRGRSVVLVGPGQPPAVHALGHAMNIAIEAVPGAIHYTAPVVLEAGEISHDLGELTRDLAAGQVDTLVILGGNPAYDAFADLDFAANARKAREVVYLGAYENETSTLAEWFIPHSHVLESWGDACASDGTRSIVQPLIAPIFGAKTPDEVLAIYLGDGSATVDAHALLTTFWKRARPDEAFDVFWRQALRDGVMPGTALPSVDVTLRHDLFASSAFVPPEDARGQELELRIAADTKVHDGRFTNNAWLLELPDPVTQLTWGNAALMSKATMARRELHDGDVVTLRHAGRQVRAVAWASPGHADDSVSLALGYGRSGSEDLAGGVGTNAYTLRTSRAPGGGPGAEIARTGETKELARAQIELDLHGRDEDILLHRTLEQFRSDPDFARSEAEPPPTLYELRPKASRQWGMGIDLNTCIGCSACVVACQAENNVPVVGEEGVRKGRRMHWLRIDRYLVEERLLAEPMLCQHCEQAPCEYVCPVHATVHSEDGLNQMVYQRCVGTRFCSNNCPYKVRRFNWFNFNADITPLERLGKNPDVTVRARGVMEKCSFCVQRIREAAIKETVSGAPLDGPPVRTACQQVCPTSAIVFGDIADPSSEVSRWRQSGRGFAVLNDLRTVPRVRYLATLRNVHPELG